MGEDGARGDLEHGTTPRLLASAAARHGARVAVEDAGRAVTYAELATLVGRAARALLARGFAKGDRAGIWAPNRLEWIVAALATHAAGGVLVPVNTRFKPAEAGEVLRRSGARALFAARGFLGVDYLASIEREDLPALAIRVALEGEEWNMFLASGDHVRLAELQARAGAVAPSDACDLLFTSGTTGKPKGVASTHAQTLRAFRDWVAIAGLREDDRYLVVPPFFHSFGYKAGWLACLMAGATILPQATFDVDAVLARIAADRVTVLPGPPTLYQSLLAAIDSRRAPDLRSLRLAVTGAAVIPVDLVRRMRRDLGFETVLTAYGLTEATGVSTMCRRDDDDATIATTSGRAIPGVQLRVVDGEGRDVAAGEPGEVLVAGYSVARAWSDDGAIGATLDRDGWLHTGDVGVLDARGNLRITDRLKDMFIVGGFNAYPAEIEQAIARHDDVAQVAVIGVPDERMGEVGMAFVVPRAGRAIDETAMIAWCRDRMANYKVPRRFAAIDRLPTNASGKVLKTQLRAIAART